MIMRRLALGVVEACVMGLFYGFSACLSIGRSPTKKPRRVSLRAFRLGLFYLPKNAVKVKSKPGLPAFPNSPLTRGSSLRPMLMASLAAKFRPRWKLSI